MDRRQRRTREAIFHAFCALLSKKDFHQITVGEIIERADVGRATFYAHFETKDFLLNELCAELFDHVFESAVGAEDAHSHIFDCNAPDSVFLHLLQHLQKNDNHILDLLSGRSNELFLQSFKAELQALVTANLAAFDCKRATALPKGLWVHHICATFVEIVRWWIDHGMQESASTIADYFFLAVCGE